MHSFCKMLVQDLEEYGRLEDGRHTLQAILEAACPAADGEWVEEREVILKDLRLQLTVIDAAALVRSEWHLVCSALTLGALLMLVLR